MNNLYTTQAPKMFSLIRKIKIKVVVFLILNMYITIGENNDKYYQQRCESPQINADILQFTEYNHRNTKLFCFYFFSQNDDVVFVLQQQDCTDESRRLQDKPTSTELQYFDQQDSQVSCL